MLISHSSGRAEIAACTWSISCKLSVLLRMILMPPLVAPRSAHSPTGSYSPNPACSLDGTRAWTVDSFLQVFLSTCTKGWAWFLSSPANSYFIASSVNFLVLVLVTVIPPTPIVGNPSKASATSAWVTLNLSALVGYEANPK